MSLYHTPHGDANTSSPAAVITLLLALGIFVGVFVYLNAESQAVNVEKADEFSRIFTAYPTATPIHGVRTDDGARMWLFTTSDTPEQVLTHQKAAAESGGWKLVKESSEGLVLSKSGRDELSVAIIASGRSTQISYSLKSQ